MEDSTIIKVVKNVKTMLINRGMMKHKLIILCPLDIYLK